MKSTRGFTLIELLVVIAILALLASILFASLNASRNKAADARIKADVRAVVIQSGIHYTNPGRPFGTAAWTANATSFTPGAGVNGSTSLFQDRRVGEALASIAMQGGAVSYGSNDTSWVVISRLKAGGYWCVDSGSASGGTRTFIPPTAAYNYGMPAYRCPFAP